MEEKIMKTTFDKFINSNPKRKEKFDKEYNEFLLSEFVLEKMESENIYRYQKNFLPGRRCFVVGEFSGCFSVSR